MDSLDDPTFDELAAQILEAAHEEEFYSSENYNQISPQYQQYQPQQPLYESHRSSSPSIYDEEVEFEFQEPRNNYEQDYDDPIYSGPTHSHSQFQYRTEPNQSQRQQSQLIAPTPRSTITSSLLQPPSQNLDSISQSHQPSSAFKPLRQIQRPVQTQPQQYYPSPPPPLPPIQSNSFPIPANGNISRRKDEHLRPAGGVSQFQVGSGGNYVNSNDQIRADSRAKVSVPSSQQKIQNHARNMESHTVRTESRSGLSKTQSIEEDYFDDDDGDFEQAMVSMENNVRDPHDTSALSTQTRLSSNQNVASGNSSSAQRRDGSHSESFISQNISNAAIKLRPVSNLPDMFRSLFKFGVFNAVQSTTFHRVTSRTSDVMLFKLTISLYIYNTNENVVVSAPTGAGKTALFELAMLRLFSTSTTIDSKVVYVAPTKSLCNERAADWKAKFGQLGLGWEVIELTGDSSSGMSNLKDVGSTRVIVTTPEKWDSMTRKWFTHERVLAKIRLLCIDECHFVGMDTRGAVLEVIVSRFKTLSPNTRFIAVSATVPNIDDVAQWLGAGISSDEMEGEERLEHEQKGPARVFKFGEEYRPCKLHKVVVSFYKKGNDFAFSSTLDYKVMDLIKTHASGKAVLIFCNTRKGCGQTANILKKEYEISLTSGRDQLPWPKPNRSVIKPNDKNLAALMENGIAFHHAGMDLHDRQLVERSFLDGSVSVVCATSTLAVGVNLPARMVIIKGTSTFVDGANIEYNDLDMLQMMGRAGRPLFDTLGVAVIMTEKDLQKKYEALANSETMLESCLHKNLIEHINSEITLRTITSVESALEWLRSTFLFVRINKRPKYYALDNSTTSPKDRLEEVVVEAVKALVKSGVVDEGENSLAPTELGNMMARFYLDHSTFTALQALPMKSSMRTLLECLSGCSEYSSIRFRLGEKKVYGEVNKTLKYPARQVTSSPDKVLILIGVVLQGIPLTDIKVENSNPSTDVMLIWKHATRILRCMVDLALERRDGGVKTIYELLRSVNARAWEGTPFTLRQLEGIGEKGIKVLSERDIFTFADVYNSEPSRLELILNRNPPFGRKLVAQARSFPQFSLKLNAESEEVVDTGIKITLEVSAGLAVKDPPPTLKKGRDSFWASILLVTSDGEYIEFRRIKIDKLLAATKVYKVSAVLVKPSQRIIASISSEELAGSEVKAEYKPTSLPGAYPLPTIEQRKLSIQDISEDEKKTLDHKKQVQKSKLVDSKLAPIFSNDKKVKEKSVSNKARVLESESESEVEIQSSSRLPNGKLACNHACKDKTSCRHMCCRDGVDSHSRKKSKSKIKDDGLEERLDSISHPKKIVMAASSKSDKVLDSLEQMPVFNFARPKARKLSYSSTSSGGVKLTRLPGGRTTAAPFDLFDESDEEGEDLPTLEKAMEVSTSSRKKQTPVIQTIFKKVVPPPPSVGLQKTTQIDELDLDSDDAENEDEGLDDDEEIDQLDSSPSPSPPIALPFKSLKRSSSSSKQSSSIKRVRSSTSTNSHLEPNPPLFREKSRSLSPEFSPKAVAQLLEQGAIEEEEVDELDESQGVQEEMKVDEKEEEKEAEVIKELTDDEADFDAWLSNVTVL